MRKIVEGLVYDTTKAESAAEWRNRYGSQDFKCYEQLYKTKSESWFLVGEGGPMSSWGQNRAGGRTYGSDLRPLSRDQALSWCEEREIDPDVVMKHFGDMLKEA